MKMRQLGASDLQVSEISLGSWLTYSGGVERDAAERCVDAAFDAGINFIDTANVYGRGTSESFLGEVLQRRSRDSYVIATKVFFPMSDTDRGLSRAQIEKQLDASLQRLKVDVIDLYQCHRADPDTPIEETMEALSRAVQAGKVRWLGFSEWPMEAVEAADALPGVEKFVSSQPQYSLIWRAPEKALIPWSREHGVSQIVWSPLGQGVLTGKYKPGAAIPPDSRAASDEMGGFLRKEWLSEPVLTAVQDVKRLADEAGLSLAAFALAWVLREPNVASAIIGASRPEQVFENAKASGAQVDPALFAEAERLMGTALGR
jgi:aryl-alcohol dehydrogenase-like predicted oxidoreductase